MVRLRTSRAGVTKILQISIQSKFFPSKESPWSLTHFPSLLYHTFMHSIKNPSGIIHIAILVAILLAILKSSMSSNRIPLKNPLSMGKTEKKKKKSHAASSGESRNNFSTAVFLSARNCQMLGGAMTFCRVLVHCQAQIMWGKPIV